MRSRNELCVRLLLDKGARVGAVDKVCLLNKGGGGAVDKQRGVCVDKVQG